MTTLSPENSLSARQSASFILVKRKPPIDKTEWDSFFDENGHLAKSRDFICVNILERGLHPFVRTEAWKFLTGYFSWQSSQDERLTVDSMRRKNYKALCQMYEKIQPLLENLHRNFIETRNNIKYQQGFHEMVMLFQLMVEHDHETFWLFQFFLQKTGKGAGAVQSLFPWFCLCFQRAFKSFDDVWRLWEVLLTGKPCRNFQVLVAYSMLQMVREQVLQESMGGDDILLACNNLIDLDADELISAACVVYAELIQKD
uniref:TBC1 domain family member 21 n=1 Tax=Saimiri boliviensis boliviensis TaxID=39432 RepID=A0A2K6SKS2_SAIBB